MTHVSPTRRIALMAAAAMAALSLAACGPRTESTTGDDAATVSDQDISEAYRYLLGRLLVLRQEKLDLASDFKWNQIVHRTPGGVAWANPNLDVAYSEAWLAVDETSCDIVTIPKITGRYYTFQVLNGWGETVANLNERTFPDHPNGRFALCLKGANVTLPAGVQRVDLPSKTSRVLARVELGANPAEAIRLQKQITVVPTGTPKIDPRIDVPLFQNNALPGAEAFDRADAVLAGEADINPGMDAIRAKVKAVAALAADAGQRARVENAIRSKAIPEFQASMATLGVSRNGWNRPPAVGNYGENYAARTLINFGGIWANNTGEVVYYKTDRDGTGTPLNGSNTYTMTFPKEALPSSKAKYFWSVIAVDPDKFQVIPNPLNRYLLNKETGVKPNPDGSLTLYFSDAKPLEAPTANWLPTPAGKGYHLTFRFYGPTPDLVDSSYFTPPLVKK